jgi:hypothetical protein
VIINRGEDSTTVLQGFTITGGTGTRWTDEHGAGIYREGGGILIQYSSPVIQFNIIKENLVTNLSGVISTGGGGIRAGDGYLRIYNNVISNNSGRYGAGIVLNYTGVELVGNVICSNYGSNSYGGGSAIWIWADFQRQKYITNNTITGNSATGNNTGGIYSSGTIAYLRNNIIWGNTSNNNQQISGGGVIVAYCNVQFGFTGAGNINTLPQFADSNYYLAGSSPCIDKGDSSTFYNDIEDPSNPGNAKFPSQGSLRNDMGAYGGPHARVLTAQLIGIRLINNVEPSGFVLYQNYPNPFNSVTNIKFSVPKSSIVTIRIFDVTGREVTKLVDKNIQAGLYEVRWNAINKPSGVYYYTLNANKFSETKRTVLIK